MYLGSLDVTPDSIFLARSIIYFVNRELFKLMPTSFFMWFSWLSLIYCFLRSSIDIIFIKSIFCFLTMGIFFWLLVKDGFNYGLSLIAPFTFGLSFPLDSWTFVVECGNSMILTLDSSNDIKVSSIMVMLLSSLTSSISSVSWLFVVAWSLLQLVD